MTPFDFTHLPKPSFFLGYEFLRTFRKREIENAAEVAVAYCASAGDEWDAPYFQLTRAMVLADVVDANVFSQGTNWHQHENYFGSLVGAGYVHDPLGITPKFVARLIECHGYHEKKHPIAQQAIRGAVTCAIAELVVKRQASEVLPVSTKRALALGGLPE